MLPPFFNLFKWNNLRKHSPQGQTRNQWLYKHGAFALYKGLWFPCKIMRHNTIGEPATILAVPVATFNLDIYPQGEVLADDCEVIYSVFADGRSIESYIQQAVATIRLTERMLQGGIKRSLNTDLVHAPKRLMRQVKLAANHAEKGETYVIETNNADQIGSITLPRTIEVVEKLWNSHDWAVQELSQLLGISYNPAHGKKERMIQNELLGDRDLTVMNREMITSRLINAAEQFGESVVHISTEIDTLDRQLIYGREDVKEVGEPDGTDGQVQTID